LKRASATGLVLLFALAVAAVASAESGQDGNAIVHFKGGISPHALPRGGMAPVSVGIDSSFEAADGSDPPPQLRTIEVEINRHGKIFDRGLPSCHVREIQPATIAAARRICGGAIVGSGRVGARVDLENQRPFDFNGPLLVFKAPRSSTGRHLIAQVYGSKPPSAFVLSFRVLHKANGNYGTVITTSLPESAHKWAYVTHFEMTLHRIYTYRGVERSYVSASCAAPAGFPGAVYPFAKGSFGFGDASQVTVSLTRDCTVRQ